jgi:hypothetical protein
MLHHIVGVVKCDMSVVDAVHTMTEPQSSAAPADSTKSSVSSSPVHDDTTTAAPIDVPAKPARAVSLPRIGADSFLDYMLTAHPTLCVTQDLIRQAKMNFARRKASGGVTVSCQKEWSVLHTPFRHILWWSSMLSTVCIGECAQTWGGAHGVQTVRRLLYRLGLRRPVVANGSISTNAHASIARERCIRDRRL